MTIHTRASTRSYRATISDNYAEVPIEFDGDDFTELLSLALGTVVAALTTEDDETRGVETVTFTCRSYRDESARSHAGLTGPYAEFYADWGGGLGEVGSGTTVTVGEIQ